MVFYFSTLMSCKIQVITGQNDLRVGYQKKEAGEDGFPPASSLAGMTVIFSSHPCPEDTDP